MVADVNRKLKLQKEFRRVALARCDADQEAKDFALVLSTYARTDKSAADVAVEFNNLRIMLIKSAAIPRLVYFAKHLAELRQAIVDNTAFDTQQQMLVDSEMTPELFDFLFNAMSVNQQIIVMRQFDILSPLIRSACAYSINSSS